MQILQKSTLTTKLPLLAEAHYSLPSHQYPTLCSPGVVTAWDYSNASRSWCHQPKLCSYQAPWFHPAPSTCVMCNGPSSSILDEPPSACSCFCSLFFPLVDCRWSLEFETVSTIDFREGAITIELWVLCASQEWGSWAQLACRGNRRAIIFGQLELFQPKERT